MRAPAHIWKVVLLSAVSFTSAAAGEPGLLTFVFGPSSGDAARQSARAAAATARHWLQAGRGPVQLWRAGGAGARDIGANMSAQEIERAFSSAAFAARDTDAPSFLVALESAAQVTALHSGARVVVAVLNSPSFSNDGEHTLARLAEFCQGASVRVLALDISRGARVAPNPAINASVIRTGGAWLDQAKALEPEVATVAAAASDPEVQGRTPTADPTAESSRPAPVAPGAIPRFEIPVHIRFLRTSGTGSMSNSIMDHEPDLGRTATVANTGSAGTSVGSSQIAYQANDSSHPLQGLVAVESPFSALKFDIDDDAGVYHARARLTAIVRNARGVAIWTGGREVTVHGPVRGLDARRKGSLFLMRGVGLVGRGPFTLEARVEDLLAGSTGSIKTPLQTGGNAFGLMASDALVVRPSRGSEDRFEADQVLSYEGDVLSPVLDPIFRAEEPVALQIYLRLYPDTRGDLPKLSLEVPRMRKSITFTTDVCYLDELCSSIRRESCRALG